MTIGFDRPDWQEFAACKGVDPDLFYSGRGDFDGVEKARSVCTECPVRNLCGLYAIDNIETHGMWGGLSERQRRTIRSDRKRESRLRSDAYLEAVGLGVRPPALPVVVDGQRPCEECRELFTPTNRGHRFCSVCGPRRHNKHSSQRAA